MKIIGITVSESMDQVRSYQYVYEAYITAIERAGGVPIILPISEDLNVIKQQIKCVDGLLISGGIDVNPLLYQETCSFEQGESSTKRDLYEIALIKEASHEKKPILGICRGLQVINVAFGGSLYQDNKLIGPYIHQHTQKEKRDFPSHIMRIQKDTFLRSIFGPEAYVNSFHHQSIHRLANDFIVVAKSEDSIIEAIQHKTLPIYAVQFHPELMCLRYQKMQDIFNEFIERC